MFWATTKSIFQIRNLVKLYYLTILFFYFCYKIIESGWIVGLMIVKGSRGDQGGMMEYHTNVKKSWQLVLLFNMLSMTPGSLSVDLNEDGSIIHVHLLNIHDKDQFLKVTGKVESLLMRAL
jgi:multisubunit Na+/H+ antiporter MnhE subunit